MVNSKSHGLSDEALKRIRMSRVIGLLTGLKSTLEFHFVGDLEVNGEGCLKLLDEAINLLEKK